MNIKWVQSLLMGFVTGFCEPMPLSGTAHRGLLHVMFGNHADTPLFLLLSRVAILVVLLMVGKLDVGRLNRARKLERTSSRRRSAQPDLMSVNTLKQLRMPALLVVISRLAGTYLEGIADQMHILPFLLVLGGIVLWVPAHLRTGNKDARNMDHQDGLYMGIGAALGALPGISPVGSAMSVGSVLGVSRRYGLRFAWLLAGLSLGVGIAVEAIWLIGSGFQFELMAMLHAVLGAAGAAAGAYLGIQVMFSLIRSVGITGFCYYNWGMALLCLILFLMV